MNGKATNLALITIAQVLALSLWFSGTAAGPGMAREAGIAVGSTFQALLTGAVQAGFVLGTLISAVLTLADRYDPRRFFITAALLGAAVNAAILVFPAGSAMAIAARFLTGAALAGVYPVGMKLAVGWADRGDTGLVIGILVGGLTLGSASPHLANALGGLDWRLTLTTASLAAVLGAGLIGLVKLGPRHAPAAPSSLPPRWSFGATVARGSQPSAISATCGNFTPCGPGSGPISPPASRHGAVAAGPHPEERRWQLSPWSPPARSAAWPPASWPTVLAGFV
ncbi:MFS transporter [Pseudoroseomonas wenyumeiae]